MEIKKMLQMSDQLILQKSLIRKPEVIFETNYRDRIEITKMTTIKGDTIRNYHLT